MTVIIYICIIIRVNVMYDGHRSVQKLWSFYWIKVSQLRFIFVFFIYILITIFLHNIVNVELTRKLVLQK